MNSLRKVLVVDDGERASVDPLSAELAELGVSSVTTSLGAAREVLALLQAPSVIFLKMPRTQTTEYHAFLVLADQLRRDAVTTDIPLVMWDGSEAHAGGGVAALLASVAERQRLAVTV